MTQNQHQQLNVYFQNAILNYNQQANIISKYINVKDQIYQKITNGIIQLPNQQKPFKLQLKEKYSPDQQKQNQQQLLRNLEESRRNTLQKLKEIQRSQFQIKSKNRIITLRKSKQISYSEEDKKTLAIILKKKKKYQQELQNLTKQKNKQYQQSCKKQLQIEAEQKQKDREIRRSIIQQHFKFVQLDKERVKSQKKKLRDEQNDLKNKKYLYQIIKENYLKQKQEIEKQKQKQLNKIHQRYHFNIQDIKQHQKKYEQIMMEKKQKFQKKLINMKLNLSKISKNYQQSYFKKIIRQEQQQIKKKLQQKELRADQFKKRICQFQQHIDKNIRPTIQAQKNTIISPKTNINLRKNILSSIQLRSLGNKYMEKSKQISKQIMKSKGSIISKSNKQLQPLNPKIQYKNYLRQLKTRSHYINAQQQFADLVRKGSQVNDYQSANKAFFLAQKMNAKAKKLKDQKLYESAKNKIQLLKALI